MNNKIVTREEWLHQRMILLNQEKEFTRKRDELAQKKRSLPWVKIEKAYIFDTENGSKSLSDLFEDKSQLIIYHFMFGPDWGSEGCKSCSLWADQYDPIIQHINRRDVTMLAVSRGPLSKILPFKAKMGWSFDWVSSEKSSFNFDFNVTMHAEKESSYNYKPVNTQKESEMPGISVFYKNEKGTIFHTYSCFARELETFNTAYRYLDIVPKGRDEDDLPYGMAWVKHHYKY